MKILKHGFRKPPKPPKPVVYKKECIRCGCFFEYVIEDEEFDWFVEHEDGSKRGHGFVYCPDCGKRIVVSDAISFGMFSTQEYR